jgi:hypothetical protein
MALFNFNNNLISSLNTFNDLSKDRYLSWLDKPKLIINNTSFPCGTKYINYDLSKGFKRILINRMPEYCKDKDLGQYPLECTEVNRQITS